MPTSAVLERVGAALGEREGTGPDDDPLLGGATPSQPRGRPARRSRRSRAEERVVCRAWLPADRRCLAARGSCSRPIPRRARLADHACPSSEATSEPSAPAGSRPGAGLPLTRRAAIIAVFAWACHSFPLPGQRFGTTLPIVYPPRYSDLRCSRRRLSLYAADHDTLDEVALQEREIQGQDRHDADHDVGPTARCGWRGGRSPRSRSATSPGDRMSPRSRICR